MSIEPNKMNFFVVNVKSVFSLWGAPKEKLIITDMNLQEIRKYYQEKCFNVLYDQQIDKFGADFAKKFRETELIIKQV